MTDFGEGPGFTVSAKELQVGDTVTFSEIFYEGGVNIKDLINARTGGGYWSSTLIKEFMDGVFSGKGKIINNSIPGFLVVEVTRVGVVHFRPVELRLYEEAPPLWPGNQCHLDSALSQEYTEWLLENWFGDQTMKREARETLNAVSGRVLAVMKVYRFGVDTLADVSSEGVIYTIPVSFLVGDDLPYA